MPTANVPRTSEVRGTLASAGYVTSLIQHIIAGMTVQDFEQVIIETMEHLPPQFQERLDNVDIVLEEYADAYTLRQAGLNHPEQLLGFYHGVPLTARTGGYAMVTPDKISIYRQPILHY